MQDKNKVLQEYNVLKRIEDDQLKGYISHANKQMLDDAAYKRHEEFTRNRHEDLERLERLKITNDEEARRKAQEKHDHLDTQNKFIEYRGKLKENERQEDLKKTLDYVK